MQKEKQIKYRIHIPIICVLLIVQFFSSDIFAYFYLKSAEKRFMEANSLDGKLYGSGEYTPLLAKDPYSKIPRDYKFVFVRKNGDLTEETYYTKKGEMIEATYVGNRVQRVSGKSEPNMASFILPVIGFFITGFALFREVLRTGEIFSWRLGRHPDKTEKVCYLYGVPLFASGILFGLIKPLW